MSNTYTGWDGKSYPWPPPDGWYEASDGRWWAPGTGPNPPGAPAAPGVAAAPSPAGAPDPGLTAQLPTHDSLGAGAAAAGRTAPAEPGLGSPTTTFAGGPPPNAPGEQWDAAPPEAAPSGGRGTLGRLLLVIAGSMAALLVAGGAYLVLRDTGDGSNTAADEAAEGETTESTAAGDEQAEGDGDGAPDDAPDDTTETTAEGDATDTSGDDTSETTAAETTESTEDPDEETSTTADSSAQVGAFRALLAENGLTSDELTDEDINTFGTTFCIFAEASESPTEYSEFRTQAISDTESDLSQEELFLVIDSAVVVFCPDEAARLGIS